MKPILLTDSCCDLPLAYINDHAESIEIIGMPINLGAENFIDDLGDTNYKHVEFYNQLRSGISAKTAQITPIDFLRVFKHHYDAHRSILYLGFSSGMSGTFNNAILAKQMLLEEHPDAVIDIIDSYSASIGQGLLCMEAVKMIAEDISQEAIVYWLEEHKMKAQHWFAVSDLMYLKNGGRIPASIAAVGTLLNVKPILTVTAEGKLQSHSKVRGRKKSLRFLAEMVQKHKDSEVITTIIIAHGNCPEDAESMRSLVVSEHPNTEVIVTEISATIATHVGPNMIAIGFLGEERIDPAIAYRKTV